MKEISYGCIVIVDDQFLIGCASKRKKLGWDIPKGRGNPGETPMKAAERELYEETNIKLDSPELVSGMSDLGQQLYYDKKDLYLYAVYLHYKPTDLKCNSYFGVGDATCPEILDYKWVTLEEAKDYVYPSLYKVLDRIKNQLIFRDRLKAGH